jgi:transposase
MAENGSQVELFETPTEAGVMVINDRCRIRTQGGHRVVTISGIVLAQFDEGDALSEMHAMVMLAQQGWALQKEVAKAFGCSARRVRRLQRRFERGGLAALARSKGSKGRSRLSHYQRGTIPRLKARDLSNYEIARQVGVSEKTVRNVLRRIGWVESVAEQLNFEDGMSGAEMKVSVAPAQVVENTGSSLAPAADQDVSGAGPRLPLPLTLDSDPRDRFTDRVMAVLGLLDDAAPLFSNATGIAGAGVLLAVPALVQNRVVELAREVYGSIGPAFYGLRTTMVTLVFMALLRIKRPENLKERSPQELGRLLGLDRAPEVKSVRRKLSRLAQMGRTKEFARALAKQRAADRGGAIGFLYVDGHVRAYHGKHDLPKTHVARMRISMPATSDYWLNDAEGEPLFVVPTEAHQSLVSMLPEMLDEARSLVGERPITVVFDRGGWSPKLFKDLISKGFEIMTYRKAPFRKVAKRRFSEHEEEMDGNKMCFMLADQGIRLLKGTLRLRQVTILRKDGGQTAIVTSRRDLSAIQVAYRMTRRWRQENFFKYLREEFALDALVDYGTQEADAERDVPNPECKRLNAKLNAAQDELNKLQAQYGDKALTNPENRRKSMRGFKIAHAGLRQEIANAMKRVARLEVQRAKIPTRIPVSDTVTGPVIKLAVERKHLTDVVKMVAYQIESDLVRLMRPHYQRAEDEARTLIHEILASEGDIEVTDSELQVRMSPLSSPHRTRVLATLCDRLNATNTPFPGTKLRLRFSVRPAPNHTMAFPGPKPPKKAVNSPRPDTWAGE